MGSSKGIKMKIKILVSLGTTLVCAGCGQTDSAKVEALSLKLDAVLAGQAAITARLDAFPAWVNSNQYHYYTNTLTAIPSILRIGSMQNYFYTSSVSCFFSSQEILYNQNKVTQNLISALGNKDDLDQGKIVKDMTVQDIYDDVRDVQTDVEEIKTKLGIY
jgi:hypothetical protein